VVKRQAAARQIASLYREAYGLRIAAEKANRANGTSMANRSHVLRTPFNGKMGFARVVRQSRADAALLDLMLPRLDGSGMIGQLWADTVTQDLPVIVTGARESMDSESRTLSESTTLVMPKLGIDGERLVREIGPP